MYVNVYIYINHSRILWDTFTKRTVIGFSAYKGSKRKGNNTVDLGNNPDLNGWQTPLFTLNNQGLGPCSSLVGFLKAA